MGVCFSATLSIRQKHKILEPQGLMSSRICQVSVKMLLATGHRKDCLKLSPTGLYNNVYYLTEKISEVCETMCVMWQCPWSSPILIWFCQVLVSCSDWQRGSCQWPTSLEFRGTCDTITFLLFFFQEEVPFPSCFLAEGLSFPGWATGQRCRITSYIPYIPITLV